MSLPAPFVVPIATTPLNYRPVPNVKPLPPHQFFFSSTPAQGAGKFRVPSTQLFPEEKENHKPIQIKATHKNCKKRYLQKKKREQPKRHYLGTKIADGEYKTNLAPIPIDENTSIQLSFIIKKNNF